MRKKEKVEINTIEFFQKLLLTFIIALTTAIKLHIKDCQLHPQASLSQSTDKLIVHLFIRFIPRIQHNFTKLFLQPAHNAHCQFIFAGVWWGLLLFILLRPWLWLKSAQIQERHVDPLLAYSYPLAYGVWSPFRRVIFIWALDPSSSKIDVPPLSCVDEVLLKANSIYPFHNYPYFAFNSYCSVCHQCKNNLKLILRIKTSNPFYVVCLNWSHFIDSIHCHRIFCQISHVLLRGRLEKL